MSGEIVQVGRGGKLHQIVGGHTPAHYKSAWVAGSFVNAEDKEPDRGFPQAQTAHDTFWDFASLMPESTRMLMWILSDRAILR
jgi:catalase